MHSVSNTYLSQPLCIYMSKHYSKELYFYLNYSTYSYLFSLFQNLNRFNFFSLSLFLSSRSLLFLLPSVIFLTLLTYLPKCYWSNFPNEGPLITWEMYRVTLTARVSHFSKWGSGAIIISNLICNRIFKYITQTVTNIHAHSTYHTQAHTHTHTHTNTLVNM